MKIEPNNLNETVNIGNLLNSQYDQETFLHKHPYLHLSSTAVTKLDTSTSLSKREIVGSTETFLETHHKRVNSRNTMKDS
jgi:hypothetical protein